MIQETTRSDANHYIHPVEAISERAVNAAPALRDPPTRALPFAVRSPLVVRADAVIAPVLRLPAVTPPVTAKLPPL